MLGFIGVISFVFVKCGLGQTVSDAVFPQSDERDDELNEIIEALHMALFFIMLVFIGSIIYALQTAAKNAKNWEVRSAGPPFLRRLDPSSLLVCMREAITSPVNVRCRL